MIQFQLYWKQYSCFCLKANCKIKNLLAFVTLFGGGDLSTIIFEKLYEGKFNFTPILLNNILWALLQ